MKKLIYLIVVALGLVHTVNAQDSGSTKAKNDIAIGIKAGLNISNFVGDDAGDANSLIGFNGGIFVELKVSDKFYIQPEVLFSTQGSKSDLLLEGNNIDISFKTKYINIPVMAKYNVAKDFQLEVGPYVGFLVDADAKVTFQGQSESVDVMEVLKSNDFGLNFGFNYDFSDAIFFNARYAAGLVQIGDTGSEDDIKNSVIQFGLGFRL
ncbi:porin family protein [uncultured Flavobacterium sp.]|uniref:porin family protein n=1 Tax=uncultured Flavobacterium sp. TaxID=165435 RepID=UPI0030ED075A|tara:strand:+ start:44323 stop:44946 length:624 start_codon:yes stop_codon:yes gene_type:complete